MRIQLASDLHLSMLEKRWPLERLVRAARDAELLVLAGDIDHGVRAVERFADWPVPVLYLAGNHEFYGSVWEALRDELRRAAEGTVVRFLDNDAIVLGGVRFLGSTLWTDYRVSGGPPEAAMEAAEGFMLDHKLIRTRAGRFRAGDALDEHLRCRAWLARELTRPHDGPTVVITHHGPHPASIHPRFAGSALNGAFVSDLAQLVEQADLWMHGHVHDSFDYRVGRCRVVCNPRGYAANRDTAALPGELVFENPDFDPERVVVLTPAGSGSRSKSKTGNHPTGRSRP